MPKVKEANHKLETLSYGAEVSQLLHLVANALYSDREVFLRELISNASDAIDKLRYEALSDGKLYENDSSLQIWVSYDKTARTITIRDNGIGMNRSEIIENLGTIAKSGTRAFREMLESKKNNEATLIGQFGVGFYSAFVVSDHVVVRTRKAGLPADQGVEWASDGKGQYTVQSIVYEPRGTEITLHLKESCSEFLEGTRLRHIIKKYSDHILVPVLMHKESYDEKDKETQKTDEWETVNQANALWTRPKSEITDAEYQALYKHISHDYHNPLAWIHARVEGKSEYTVLLYIPEQAPFDLWNREHQRGLKLYVRRVFIMDDAEHFLPLYLRFVKGVIDSSDLPLNVSRELLQTDAQIDRMKNSCVKRVLDLLESMARDDVEKYQTFWKQFGQVVKEGPAEDAGNRDRILKLVRFASTHTDSVEQTVSLADYLQRMKPDQTKIYYVTAETYAAAQSNPLLEMFRKKEIEVLLLSDRVDEWLFSHVFEFEGKSFQSIAKGDLNELAEKEIPEAEKKQEEENFAAVLKQLKTALGDQVKDVRLTHRLVDSPACVVFSDDEMSAQLQRMMAAAGHAFPKPKPILELNAKHRLVLKLKEESDDARLSTFAQVLLGQALLAEGEDLENPALFVKQLNSLL